MVAQPHRADRDVFHRAFDVAEVDVLADPERVVDQEEHARDDIAHQGLRAEADRQADHAGAGDERADIDAERRQHDHRHHHAERREQGVAEQRHQGSQARRAGAAALAARLAVGHHVLFRDVAVDGAAQNFPADIGQQQRETDIENRAGHLLADALRRDVEDVEAPYAGEDHDRDQDDQQAQAAANGKLEAVRPGFAAVLDRLADGGVQQRHGNHDQQADHAGRRRADLVEQGRDRGYRCNREDIETRQHVPALAEDLSHPSARGVFRGPVVDQSGDRRAYPPNRDDDRDREQRAGDHADQRRQILLQHQRLEQRRRQHEDRADGGKADDLTMKFAGRAVVERQ